MDWFNMTEAEISEALDGLHAQRDYIERVIAHRSIITNKLSEVAKRKSISNAQLREEAHGKARAYIELTYGWIGHRVSIYTEVEAAYIQGHLDAQAAQVTHDEVE